MSRQNEALACCGSDDKIVAQIIGQVSAHRHSLRWLAPASNTPSDDERRDGRLTIADSSTSCLMVSASAWSASKDAILCHQQHADRTCAFSLRTHLTRRAHRNQARAEIESAQTPFLLRVFGDLRARRASPGSTPRPRPSARDPFFRRAPARKRCAIFVSELSGEPKQVMKPLVLLS
jgi:hypothetical protein